MYKILEEIKKILDENNIAMESDDLAWRVRFACNLLNERGDELSNIRLGLDERFVARQQKLDIADIPTQELLDDKAASLADIEVCELAILHDVAHYSGGTTQNRLDTSKKIVAVIDAELSRRAAVDQNETNNNWPIVAENDDGIRPNGSPDQCIYCQQKIGQPHRRDCVTISKIARVRYAFEIEVEIPHRWGKEEFEFHRNESSWCADNAFDDIEGHMGDDCTCECFRAEFIEDVDTTPRQKKREIYEPRE